MRTEEKIKNTGESRETLSARKLIGESRRQEIRVGNKRELRRRN